MVTFTATMLDNNTFRFNKCNFAIRSGLDLGLGLDFLVLQNKTHLVNFD